MEFRTDLIHFGYLNKNGRKYREDNVDFNELSGKTLYGEMGHPDTIEINLCNVSHVITNFEIKKYVLYGDVKVLDTPYGEILKQYILLGKKFSFRPRGQGLINDDGTIESYKIYTFDAIDSDKDSFDVTMLRRSKIEEIMKKIKNKC